MKVLDRPERIIPKTEYFDNLTQEFITIEEKRLKPIHLQLEHSLKSIARWESKWHRSFSSNEELTGEELLDYIRCMTINTVKDPDVYNSLTQEDVLEIVEYMQDPQSAWEIRQKKPEKKKRKPDTVERVYYAMIQYGIPPEYENWHYNRLMALLDYCDSNGGSTSGAGGQKKRTEREIMEAYRALNDRNRKKYNSKG